MKRIRAFQTICTLVLTAAEMTAASSAHAMSVEGSVCSLVLHESSCSVECTSGTAVCEVDENHIAYCHCGLSAE